MTKSKRKALLLRALDSDDEDIQQAIFRVVDLQGAKEFVLTPLPEDSPELDAHTDHCCQYHKRCKYAYSKKDLKQCTVANGTKPASFACNCEWM